MDRNNDMENKYISSVEDCAPDMDKLWEKIAAADSGDCDISAFEKAADDVSRPAPVISSAAVRSCAAAAAVIVAVMCLSTVINDRSMDTAGMSTVQENAADTVMNFAADEAPAEEAAVAEEESFDYQSSEWVFSTNCSSAESYEDLDLSYTDSSAYTQLSKTNEEQRYFVEDDVLTDTVYFADCKIISSYIENDVIIYEAEVIHLISKNGEIVNGVGGMSVRSVSPYSLRNGREYLLPLDDGYNIVFEDAPQIEIANDRTVVFHNGWKSLTAKSSMISYPQVYKDDYFYDRMNITAEAGLQQLFDKWQSI